MASSPTLTASIVCAAKLVGYGVARGLEIGPLVAVAGVFTRDMLGDPSQRIPVDRVIALWAHVISKLDDAGVPIHVARMTSVEDHDLMGLAIITARDGDDALRRAMRYGSLFTEAGSWKVRTQGPTIEVEWRPAVRGSLGARASAECAVAEFVHSMRLLVDTSFAPSGVTFAHRAPQDSSAHRHFFACTVEFDSAWTGFRFRRDVLDRFPGQTNAAVSAFVTRHADRMLSRLQSAGSLEERVRGALALELAGGGTSSLSLAAVARRLGTAERTLRRRLAEEGFAFRVLLDEVRRSRAEELLEEGVPVKEVAFLVGFSEPSAFSRAYRRWTGGTPSRRALGPAG